MTFFRQYIAPFFIVLIFLVAMVAVSARIFLPSDLAAPAPIDEPAAYHPIQPILAHLTTSASPLFLGTTQPSSSLK